MQGREIHVSVTLPEAGRQLDVVWDHCVASHLSFKFLHSRAALPLTHARYAPHGASGQFINICPANEPERYRFNGKRHLSSHN